MSMSELQHLSSLGNDKEKMYKLSLQFTAVKNKTYKYQNNDT